MSYKTDAEIAHESPMRPIGEIAAKLGLDEAHISPYGHFKAKITPVKAFALPAKQGRLILVTAINPTPAGEGKTTVTIGLADALNRLGKNAVVAMREPSLGPVFGIKGGAAGGAGHPQVVARPGTGTGDGAADGHFAEDGRAQVEGPAGGVATDHVDAEGFAAGEEAPREGGDPGFVGGRQAGGQHDPAGLGAHRGEVGDVHR